MDIAEVSTLNNLRRCSDVRSFIGILIETFSSTFIAWNDLFDICLAPRALYCQQLLERLDMPIHRKCDIASDAVDAG